MGDPFTGSALVEATVAAAVAVDHPHAVGEWTGVKEQVVVIRAKLHVRNRVAAQDDLALAALRVDDG
ncbi:MAG: hypothetical protein R2932_43360 [Caldilineaceae bacterium]